MTGAAVDCRRTALWYRVLRFSIITALAAFVALGWSPLPIPVRLAVLVATSLAVLVSADQMLRGQGKESYVRGSYLLLLFVPVFNFFAVLLLLDLAADDLRRRGLRVAWHGVPRSELDKLLPNHCISCGYDRSGLESDVPCPECGMTPVAADQLEASD